MVENEVEGAIGEEVCGDVEVSIVFCAQGEGLLGEAMGWNVAEGGGEDGGFCFAVWRRFDVFVRVV